MPWRRMTQGRCGCTQANFASSIVAPGKDKNWDLCSSRARTSWPFKVGTKRRYGITTLNYVISQKSADLIYTAAQAWIVSRNTKSTPVSQTQMLAVPGDTEICNFNMKYTSHWVLRIKITTFRVLFCICGNSEASFVSIFPGIHTEILLSVAAWTPYSYMTRGCQTDCACDRHNLLYSDTLYQRPHSLGRPSSPLFREYCAPFRDGEALGRKLALTST